MIKSGKAWNLPQASGAALRVAEARKKCAPQLKLPNVVRPKGQNDGGQGTGPIQKIGPKVPIVVRPKGQNDGGQGTGPVKKTDPKVPNVVRPKTQNVGGEGKGQVRKMGPKVPTVVRPKAQIDGMQGTGPIKKTGPKVPTVVRPKAQNDRTQGTGPVKKMGPKVPKVVWHKAQNNGEEGKGPVQQTGPKVPKVVWHKAQNDGGEGKGTEQKISKVPTVVQATDQMSENSLRHVCKFERKIGQGNYGAVYKVLFKGQPACFKLALDERAKKSFSWEIKFLRKLDGRGGSPKVLCAAEDSSWFVMEFLPGDLLADIICDHPYSTSLAYLQIFVEIACQLQKMHELEVVHNDLKCNNIIITCHPEDRQNSFEARIFDLGMGTHVGDPCLYLGEQFNPDSHYPPELYGREVTPSTAATDTYQLGLMMSKATARLEKSGHVTDWPHPDFLRKFIENMMDPSPSRRPSMRQVIKFLDTLIRLTSNHHHP